LTQNTVLTGFTMVTNNGEKVK